MENQIENKTESKRRILNFAAIFVVISSTACHLENPTKFEPNKPPKVVASIDTGSKNAGVISQPIAPASDWKYYEEEDKMTSKKIVSATVSAAEMLHFDFPYSGGSKAKFTIRKQNGRIDIYLRVSQGQFNSSFSGGNLKIRFDQNPLKVYSFSGASDGSSDIIFINSAKDIISRIKSSKKMLIEVEFYNEGLRQIEFNVEGLEWGK